MFSPKYMVFGAALVSLLLAVMLISTQGAATPGDPGLRNTDSSYAPIQAGTGKTAPQSTSASRKITGSATLDLAALTKANSIDEADNVRWSLVRHSAASASVYSSSTGVNWKSLRKLTQSGTFSLPASSSFSFNQTFQEGVGYKLASGVLAGGQCALATVMRAAAIKAGLPNKASPHRRPIPGFPLSQTVNIWWGTYDLVIQNPTSQNLTMAWTLTPTSVKIEIYA